METQEKRYSPHTFPLRCSVCGNTPTTTMLTINGKWAFLGQNESLRWLSKPPYEMLYFCHIMCILDFVSEKAPSLAEDWKSQRMLPKTEEYEAN